MVAVSTTSRANQARNGQGKWVRTLASAERDAEAAKLASQGWSYDRTSEALGYAGRGDAHRGARRAMAELAEAHGAGELRRQQIESNRLLREKLWEIVENPGPLTDRVGRPVHDDDGNVVYDAQAVIQAAQTILKCDERIARLAGLDAPRRSVSLTLDQALDEAKRLAAEEYGYDPSSAEAHEAWRAWMEDGAPLNLGRIHWPPLAEFAEEQQAEVRAAMARARSEGERKVITARVMGR
jgi:hypothetical protein